MGMCASKPNGSIQAIAEIEKGRQQQEREIKVLLLGAGESGKSMFLLSNSF